MLFVCTANICRSPYLELRSKALAGSTTVRFESAGTHGFLAQNMDPTMAQVLIDRGGSADDLAGFRSRRLTRELVASADLVLTAESAHRAFVLDEVPQAFRSVYSLGQFAESLTRIAPEVSGVELVKAAGNRRGAARFEHDIHDPYRQGPTAAETSADQIDALLRAVLPRLVPSALG